MNFDLTESLEFSVKTFQQNIILTTPVEKILQKQANYWFLTENFVLYLLYHKKYAVLLSMIQRLKFKFLFTEVFITEIIYNYKKENKVLCQIVEYVKLYYTGEYSESIIMLILKYHMFDFFEFILDKFKDNTQCNRKEVLDFCVYSGNKQLITKVIDIFGDTLTPSSNFYGDFIGHCCRRNYLDIFDKMKEKNIKIVFTDGHITQEAIDNLELLKYIFNHQVVKVKESYVIGAMRAKKLKIIKFILERYTGFITDHIVYSSFESIDIVKLLMKIKKFKVNYNHILYSDNDEIVEFLLKYNTDPKFINYNSKIFSSNVKNETRKNIFKMFVNKYPKLAKDYIKYYEIFNCNALDIFKFVVETYGSENIVLRDHEINKAAEIDDYETMEYLYKNFYEQVCKNYEFTRWINYRRRKW